MIKLPGQSLQLNTATNYGTNIHAKIKESHMIFYDIIYKSNNSLPFRLDAPAQVHGRRFNDSSNGVFNVFAKQVDK